jgi:hypothetical protein
MNEAENQTTTATDRAGTAGNHYLGVVREAPAATTIDTLRPAGLPTGGEG